MASDSKDLLIDSAWELVAGRTNHMIKMLENLSLTYQALWKEKNPKTKLIPGVQWFTQHAYRIKFSLKSTDIRFIELLGYLTLGVSRRVILFEAV